jgi:hypothetical protein
VVVIEREIVIRCENFATAVHQLFMLFYILNLEYPSERKRAVDFYLFCQKVLFELDANKLNPKLTSFVSALARLE